jgi:hypothetical protein
VPEDLFLAQLYLLQHGKTFDEKKTRKAIEVTTLSGGQIKLLIEFGSEMRHEAFVPSLVELSEDSAEANYNTAQRALETITFLNEIRDRASWRQWANAHSNETRTVWIGEASSKLLELAKTNSQAAKEFFDKRTYTWNDPALLPTIQKLIEFKALHSQIVGWINLTYARFPHLPGLREQLRDLAVRIQAEGQDGLEVWAKRLMNGWDFLYEDKGSWDQFVHMNNMRV